MSWYDGKKGEEAIEREKLIEGHLYEIYARGGNVGIYSATIANGKPGFEIARYKFGYRLDVEYEWDAHERFGTAYAKKDLGKAGWFRDDAAKLEYLIEKELKLQMDKQEKFGKLAREYAREEKYAEDAILRIRLQLKPGNTLLGRRGCDTSPTFTCCYRQTEYDATECVYCKRSASPDEDFLEGTDG